MKQFVAIWLGLWFFSQATGHQCRCKPPEPNKTTHPGGNEIITVMEQVPYKCIEGRVQNIGGQALKDVLVEVLDRPEWITKGLVASPVGQKRIKACKTDALGRFCFHNIPAGKYEICASKDSEWNPSHVYVVVQPHNRKATKKKLVIHLTPGS
ncbi:MAG: carboxypeptidase regulatory-like domain-containing protein [Acidobacteria bacterium]|nr:carboxypeptidase regulatory-like domain-containing protein [Acidobacteriota bacterium]